VNSAPGHVTIGIGQGWCAVALLVCLIIQRGEPRPKEKPVQDPGHLAATCMPCLPFRLDIEDQGWLEVLVEVDKGQLLVWMGSGQQY